MERSDQSGSYRSSLQQHFLATLDDDSGRPELAAWIEKRDLEVGTLIVNIESNSPASRAGLKKDDLIVAINGQQVGNTPTSGPVDVLIQASRYRREWKSCSFSCRWHHR